MPTQISRVWYTTLIDDDGSGTTGTPWAKASVDAMYGDINAIFAGSVTFGGTVNSEVIGTHRFSGASPGGNTLRIFNTQAASTNWAAVQIGNDVAEDRSGLYCFSTQYATSGAQKADGALLAANGSGGLVLSATSGAATVELWTNGSRRQQWNPDGSIEYTAAAPSAWTFNGIDAAGGQLRIQKNGTNLLNLGPGSIIGFGGANDANVYAGAGALMLESAVSVRSTTVYAATTSDPANVNIQSNYSLTRSTSSLRYKRDVQPLEAWRWLLALSPITFRDRARPGRRYGGLAAEDVAAHGPRGEDGRPQYAGLDADGRPDDVAYTQLVAPLVAAVQELHARLASLERKDDPICL
jgi:hypothetical protein